MSMTLDDFIEEECARDRKFAKALEKARKRHERLIERPCREGNCVELFDPATGKVNGGWGPVGCPCDYYVGPNLRRAEYDRRRRQR